MHESECSTPFFGHHLKFPYPTTDQFSSACAPSQLSYQFKLEGRRVQVHDQRAADVTTLNHRVRDIYMTPSIAVGGQVDRADRVIEISKLICTEPRACADSARGTKQSGDGDFSPSRRCISCTGGSREQSNCRSPKVRPESGRNNVGKPHLTFLCSIPAVSFNSLSAGVSSGAGRTPTPHSPSSKHSFLGLSSYRPIR